MVVTYHHELPTVVRYPVLVLFLVYAVEYIVGRYYTLGVFICNLITSVNMTSTGGALGTETDSKLATLTADNIIHEKIDKYDSDDPSTSVENGDIYPLKNDKDETGFLSHEEQFPEDPNAELETQQFTARAVIVGCILGGVIAASK
jgi:hypothetical protein